MYNIKEFVKGVVQFIHDADAQYSWQFQTGNVQVNGGAFIPAMHIVGGGNTPTGTGSAHASFTSVAGTDQAGRIIMTVDGTGGTGAIGILIFANPYATAPYIDMQPATASVASQLMWAVASTNGFTFNSGVSPAITSTFAFNYSVVG